MVAAEARHVDEHVRLQRAGSRFGFRVSSFEFGVWCFEFRVSGFEFRVSGFGFRVSGFEFRVSGFGFRVSGFGFRVSGFEFRVSGFGGGPSVAADARHVDDEVPLECGMMRCGSSAPNLLAAARVRASRKEAPRKRRLTDAARVRVRVRVRDQ